jgi:acyl-CoA thioesterase-1
MGMTNGTAAVRTLIRHSAWAALAIGALLTCGPADAATVRIVALGASNTTGHAMPKNLAWPAQLEAMLRARGYDVSITNAGIGGDDTTGMLARIGRDVPGGTAIVILDKAAGNDRKRGIATAANVAAIAAKLQARQIRLLEIADLQAWAKRQLQDDGIHITAGGHAALAAQLLPRVIALLGKRGLSS